MTPALFFLRVSLALGVFCDSHVNFRNVFATFVKNGVGVLMEIALNP